MTTRGDEIGYGGRPRVGTGVSVPPLPVQDPLEIVYESWQAGLITADSPEDIPLNAAQQAIDVRIERNDSLTRMEGIQLQEDVTPRSLLYIFQHASLDFSTELVVIDSPYVGHKSTGSFIFDNNGIVPTGSKGWNVVNVAGVLLFSNGVDGTYTRDPGAVVVTDISADIIADTFATAFGRVFAGAVTDPLSGYQGLMMRWNGTGSPPESDWSSPNAQAELLLSNQQEADRIVANRPIGFDALAILTRKQQWMGYPTGQDNHPAQFRLRFAGRGCVAEPTAVVTPYGACFLSDEGVVLTDLNNSNIISAGINASLLPLNYTQLDQYRAVYQPIRDRYILVTPAGTWYYEFPRQDPLAGFSIPGRWYFSSFVPDSLVIFTDQSGNVYWATVPGFWADQTLTWAEMAIGEMDAPPVLYMGRGSELGFEDAGTYTNLGDEQNPLWVTSQAQRHVTDLINTLQFEIEFESTDQATVQFLTADWNGNFTNIRTVVLPNTNGFRKTGIFPFTGAGKGSAVQIKYITKNARIARLRQVYLPMGKTQTNLQILD